MSVDPDDDDRLPALSVVEIMAKPAIRWPVESAVVTGIPAGTQRALRARGDHPRLFGVGRSLYTTPEALREWILLHELDSGARLRVAGPGRPRRTLRGQGDAT
ncbi:MAG: hypothetical protein U1E86_06405 [Burkholderiaceae bacterium]